MSRNDRVLGKGVIHAAFELPSRHVNVYAHQAAQLDPFCIVVFVERVIVDLVKDHHAVSGLEWAGQPQKDESVEEGGPAGPPRSQRGASWCRHPVLIVTSLKD